ncbi:MAG TPA: squalene/phytoene synthase family protein [Polyangiaceae bacterium]|nr:squalene/phytoene synthase family protein [Polyangiaceae bacterium]
MTALKKSDLSALAASIRERDRRLYYAALAVAPPARDAWWAVLAFRRALRDAVLGDSKGSVDDLRERVDRAFGRRPGAAPLDRAVAWLAEAHDAPRACFDAQLDAATWDLDGRRYHTAETLVGYAVRAAGSVAVLGAVAMGRRRAAFVERAIELGVAFELTRVARDVLADGARGKLYLPIEWLEEAGVDVDRFLEQPRASTALADVTSRVASAAERFYLRAEGGLADVPHLYRPIVRAARWLGAAELRDLADAGFDPSRATGTTPLRAAAITLRALRAGSREAQPAPKPASSAEARWLVDAVAR